MDRTTRLSLLLALVGAVLVTTGAVADTDPVAPAAEAAEAEGDEAARLVDAEILELADLDFDGAAAIYESILEGDARKRVKARALFNLSRVERKRGNIGRAGELLKRFIAEHPEEKGLLDVARRVLDEINTGKPEIEEFDWLEEFANDPAIRAQIFEAAVAMSTKDERSKARAKLKAMGPIAIPIIEQVSQTASGYHKAALQELLFEAGDVEVLGDLLDASWNSSLAGSVASWQEPKRRRAHEVITRWIAENSATTVERELVYLKRVHALRLATGIPDHFDADLAYLVDQCENSGLLFFRALEPFLETPGSADRFKAWWSRQGDAAPRVALELVANRFPEVLTPEYLDVFKSATIASHNMRKGTETLFLEAWRDREVMLDQNEIRSLSNAACSGRADWIASFLVDMANSDNAVRGAIQDLACPIFTAEIRLRILLRSSLQSTFQEIESILRTQPELIPTWFQIMWDEELPAVMAVYAKNYNLRIDAIVPCLEYALDRFDDQPAETRRYLALWFVESLYDRAKIDEREIEWANRGTLPRRPDGGRRGPTVTRSNTGTRVDAEPDGPSASPRSGADWFDRALAKVLETLELPNRNEFERRVGFKCLYAAAHFLRFGRENATAIAASLDTCIFERASEFAGHYSFGSFEHFQALSDQEQIFTLLGGVRGSKVHGKEVCSAVASAPLGPRSSNRLFWAMFDDELASVRYSVDQADRWTGFEEWGLSNSGLDPSKISVPVPSEIFAGVMQSDSVTPQRRRDLLKSQIECNSEIKTLETARIALVAESEVAESYVGVNRSHGLARWLLEHRHIGLGSSSDPVAAWCLEVEDVHDPDLQSFIDERWQRDGRVGYRLRNLILESTHLAALRWLHEMVSEDRPKHFREAVIARLEFFADESSLPVLKTLIADPDIEIRNAAIAAMTKIQDAVRTRKLIEKGLIPEGSGRSAGGDL